MAQKVVVLKNENAKIENSTDRNIMWRNFAGVVRPGHKYDKEGEPYFNVSLSPDVADQLRADGWAVEQWISKNAEPGDIPTDYIKVTVDVNGWNKSKIWHVGDPDKDGKRHKNLMVPGTPAFADLDHTVFDEVDLTLRPWTMQQGKHAGEKKAYLETMYYLIAKDEWSDKWGSVMDESDYGSPAEDEEEMPF